MVRLRFSRTKTSHWGPFFQQRHTFLHPMWFLAHDHSRGLTRDLVSGSWGHDSGLDNLSVSYPGNMTGGKRGSSESRSADRCWEEYVLFLRNPEHVGLGPSVVILLPHGKSLWNWSQTEARRWGGVRERVLRMVFRSLNPVVPLGKASTFFDSVYF